MAYGNPSVLNGNRDFDVARLADNYMMWMAHYYWEYGTQTYKSFDSFLKAGRKTGYSYNGKSGHFEIWQFTSTGYVPGISGNVDLNISYVNF